MTSNRPQRCGISCDRALETGDLARLCEDCYAGVLHTDWDDDTDDDEREDGCA